MVRAGAAGCLQADATRCGGNTVWLRAAALAEAAGLQISGHCAPPTCTPTPPQRYRTSTTWNGSTTTHASKKNFPRQLRPTGREHQTRHERRTGLGLPLRQQTAARYRDT
ncbi:enolase C-terminal domain-like protein [Streptomyces avermitilis]|uniref:enolase C-terminal domain-like protein n=1 Tax=Streptomyces avermitilis TaxID=33903 RepID=UPI0033CF492F